MMSEKPDDRPAPELLRIRSAEFQDPKRVEPTRPGSALVPPSATRSLPELSYVDQPGMPGHAGAPPIPPGDGGGPDGSSPPASAVRRFTRLAAISVGIIALCDAFAGAVLIVGGMTVAGSIGLQNGLVTLTGLLLFGAGLLIGRSAYRLSQGDTRGVRRSRKRIALQFTVPIGIIGVAVTQGGVSVSQLVFAVMFFLVLAAAETFMTLALELLPEPPRRGDPPREH